MPKQKPELTDKEIEKITSQVLSWPIENRTNLVLVVSKSIVAEADEKKLAYETAEASKNSINNGK